MTGDEQACIRRTEPVGDQLRVVVVNQHAFHDIDGQTLLSSDYPDLFVVATNEQTVLVGTGAHHPDSDGWHIHGANGIYAEVPLEERELTDAEVAWCEETFMFAGDSRPETVLEATIPHPEALREAILDERLDAFDCLEATIRDADARHRVLTALQASIEREAVRRTKLNGRKGRPVDLAPEWDPENDHNDDRDREHLYDMAGMRADAHKADFREVVGYPYREVFCARARVLDVHELDLDHHELVALDVAGYDDWTYCRRCGGVAPAEAFFHVEKRHYEEGQTFRVCGRCLDRWAGRLELPDGDWTRGPWTEPAAAEARDRHVQENGGQRRLEGDYEPDTNR